MAQSSLYHQFHGLHKSTVGWGHKFHCNSPVMLCRMEGSKLHPFSSTVVSQKWSLGQITPWKTPRFHLGNRLLQQDRIDLGSNASNPIEKAAVEAKTQVSPFFFNCINNKIKTSSSVPDWVYASHHIKDVCSILPYVHVHYQRKEARCTRTCSTLIIESMLIHFCLARLCKYSYILQNCDGSFKPIQD